MNNSVIVGVKRTPFGAFGGSLKSFSATDLAYSAAKGCLDTVGLPTQDIQHVVIGQVVGASSDSAYLPRHLSLRLGLPVETPSYSVNRLCGSGFQSWIEAALWIATGQADVVLAGGTESMSQIPFIAKGLRFGEARLGNQELEDLLSSSLTDQLAGLSMALTAEKLGEQFKITREEVDQYALLSQQRYQRAFESGLFKNEITPVTIKTKKGNESFDKDEHAKFDSTLEKIQSLKPLFKKDGLVTAGTASGIVDGAAATLITSENYARKNNLKPLARIIHSTVVGCSPDIMGIGPAPAIEKLLKETQLKMNQIDLIEVNEAFAAQYLAVEKALNLPREKTNRNGGAIALGHPLAASGTRIMNHLCLELIRTQKKYAIGSACIGGGQGIAILMEHL